MCAKYVMQEAVDLNNEGKTLRYPRMVMEQCCETDELARWVASGTTYGEGEVRGILSEVARWMALTMAQGRSVRREGLGLFTPALGVRRGKEREEADGSTGRRNASSIRVSRIHFRADRELVRATDRHCVLERASGQGRRSVSKYTPEERLALAQRYLEQHPAMSIGDYAALTGLSASTAGRELRRWYQTPGTGIGASGFGTHRVYVKREEG